MISEKISQVLNEQLNREFHSGYIYLGMSAFASSIGFNGCAKWFNMQYQEEMMHAMKLFKYLEDQGSEIELKDIKSPKIKAKSIIEAFEESLKHEQSMTKALNELSDITMKEKDHATYNLLQWYVTEQVEEEASFKEIIDNMKMVGENGFGLYTLDKELGTRVFDINSMK